MASADGKGPGTPGATGTDVSGMPTVEAEAGQRTHLSSGRFADRVVVVTGAAQGIGRAVAERVAAGSVTVVGMFLDLRTARLYLVGAEEITEVDQDAAAVGPVREVSG